MPQLLWSLTDELKDFDLEETGARPGSWDGREALHLNGFHTIPSLFRDEIPYECYRIEAEVAVPGPDGFIGLVFGARDKQNYELVYISPGNDTSMGEIQYDPIMNGSSTWQIYNGPVYQAPAPFPAGKWTKLALVVQPHGVTIRVGDEGTPQLVISNLQHGRANGKIGFWGNLPGYIRNFAVEQIETTAIARRELDLPRLASDSFITEWLVSEPYKPGQADTYQGSWKKATVEENGCLNFNRLYSAAGQGAAVQAKCSFSFAEGTESRLSLGFSDGIRLWINDEEVYQGETKWNPPSSDGRIRADHATVPVQWKAGENTIRAEVTNLEGMFGWGLTLKTGLPYFLGG